ncbi:hypothetical protein [Roseateles sp.]|uniref:hypothetical protein n=1 Tax=Roseateles sp. TaxID=1971397 RepID=UPI00286C09B6|nr:hypothetical protein [Roseateles sp.]
MDQPSTPTQVLQAWLAAHQPGAVLDGIPVPVLLEHFLQTQASGSPAAQHELKVLGVLVTHLLARLQYDIAGFPASAMAVLQQQKKALVDMHKALSELQNCLQTLLSRKDNTPKLRLLAAGRPMSWQRTHAILHARALRA